MTLSTSKKEKALVIESDGPFGERVAEALRADGYTVHLVKNGAEGLKCLYDILPHLVLLDVVLSGADSYEILKQKQAEPMLSKIPVFLLSTRGVPINMHRVPDGSVTEYLMSLHMTPDEIVSRVNRHFGHETGMIADAPPKPDLVGAVSAAEANSTKQPKLLWVEDDKLIGKILSKKLVAAGFDLVQAKNGAEALLSLKNRLPDIIMLDLVMPGMDGFTFLQEIKKDHALAKVPLVVLSNLSKQSDKDRAQILGVNLFLVKATVSLDKICRELHKVLLTINKPDTK